MNHYALTHDRIQGAAFAWTSALHPQRGDSAFFTALAHARAGELEALRSYSALVHRSALAGTCLRTRGLVLSAEEARLTGRLHDAEVLYEEALSCARRSENPLTHGAALESAEHFYGVTGRSVVAAELHAEALSCWTRSGVPQQRRTEHTDKAAADAGATLEDIDASTMFAMSQAVASEIVLDRLVSRLMTLAVEHAGASRSLLILAREAGLEVAAEAISGPSGVTVRMCNAALHAEALPESIVRYVSRTHDSVLLDDASSSSPYAGDPYFAQRSVRSVMAFPLIAAERLSGVLYLENALTSHVFIEARIALLRMFVSQAAIALENARLFGELARMQQQSVEAQRLSKTGSFTWDVQTGDMQWSDQIFVICGYETGSSATSARLLERVHPDDRSRVLEALSRGEGLNVDHRMLMPDGEIKHVRMVAQTAVRAASTQLSGALVDVTERHHAEQRLREARNRLEVTVASIADGVIATRADGTVSYLNAVAEKLTGYGQEAVGLPLDEVLRFSDDKLAQVVRSRDGAEIVVELRRTALGIGPEHAGSVVVLRDMTQRRRAEEARALATANERLELALRGSKVGVWDIDYRDPAITPAPLHTINFWEALGWPTPAEQANGARGTSATAYRPERFHSEDRAELYRRLEQHLRGEREDISIEMRVRAFDGAFRWCLYRARAIRDEHGRALRVIGTTVDITERHELESQIRAATGAAQSANRAKDEFLANVSHEIRTPMNAILGMTELALDTQLDAEQRQWLTTVKSAGDNLLVVIDELLDFSKANANKLELSLENLSLRAQLQETLRGMFVMAQRKGLALLLDVADDVPAVIRGDAGRLRQILTNLVGNAIKFTNAGEVELAVRMLPHRTERNELALAFAVRDTGVGIARDKHALIFEPFTQADVATARDFGGTGLGLSIALRLATLMNGQIEVESEPGSGSTFTLTARFAIADVADDWSLPACTKDARVLVITQNASEQTLLERWLSEAEMRVSVVCDGVDAMAVLWNGVVSRDPVSVVVVDLANERSHGSLVAKRLRERDALSSCALVTLQGELEGAVPLDKPFHKQALLEALRCALEDRAPARHGPADSASLSLPTEQGTPRALRVLVAEDSEFNADLVRALLRRRGCEVLVVDNGQRALELAEQGQFDLLLLDLHMPGLDGFQVIERLRAQEQLVGGHLPVVALTARTRSEDRELCLAAGMDEFLGKPIRRAELWAIIERLTQRRAPHESPPQ